MKFGFLCLYDEDLSLIHFILVFFMNFFI